MNQISRLAAGAALSLALAWITPAAQGQIDVAEDTWTPLFNGKNLDGWTAKIKGYPLGEDPMGTFRVEHGLLKVRYDRYDDFAGRFGHLFHSQALSHYALHIEYRFVGDQAQGGPPGWAVRNSGVMLHATAPGVMSLAQDFPVSIEAQFLGGLSDGKPRPTANVCTPGTDIVVSGSMHPQHCLYSASSTYDGDQWVNVTIVVLGGGSITHYVEGEQVLRYERPSVQLASQHAHPGRARQSLDHGFIALQSESHPIDFRQVRVANLAGCTDPQAKTFAPYFVKSDPTACVY